MQNLRVGQRQQNSVILGVANNMMEVTQFEESIEALQVDSLIWSEAEPSISQGRKSSSGLPSAPRGLNSKQILSHIKPDYGSLGEFMKDVGISKDILLHNRKKKLEQLEDLQQKKMRATLRGKNLERVLRQEGTVLEKVTASKLIIEGLFEKNFGITLSNFCAQSNSKETGKPNYSSLVSLADTLDHLLSRQKEELSAHRESKQELPVLSRNKNLFSLKEIQAMGVPEKVTKIKQYAIAYPAFRRHCISSETSGSELSLQKVFTLDRSTDNFEALAERIKMVRLQDIVTIKISGITGCDDLVSFLLDFFIGVGNQSVTELLIEDVKFLNLERMAKKVKEFVERSAVTKLGLHRIGLKSREFCFICLGVGPKLIFEHFSLRDNDINELSLKCLDVLMKFHKNTQFDFAGNPIEKELRRKPNYKRCLSSCVFTE